MLQVLQEDPQPPPPVQELDVSTGFLFLWRVDFTPTFHSLSLELAFTGNTWYE